MRASSSTSSGRRAAAYHLYRSHPATVCSLAQCRALAGGYAISTQCVCRPAKSSTCFVPCGLDRSGATVAARALVKLNELDQYDDAELVQENRRDVCGLHHAPVPEDNLMGEGLPDASGAALAGLEPGTMQILEPGEDVVQSARRRWRELRRIPAHAVPAVAAAMGITYEMLTGDLTQVNYSSIRAGLLEFRRRCEAIQHGVIVHQLCRPIWRAWMEQALLEGALALPQFTEKARLLRGQMDSLQGWRWVDPRRNSTRC